MYAVLSRIFLALTGLSLGAASPAQSQAAPSAPQDAADQLHEAERAHLARVLAWGGTNAAAGVALLLATDAEADPALHGFAVQTAAWGAINAGIGAIGLALGERTPVETWHEAVRRERRFADILLLNLGLNVGYMGVGTAVWLAGTEGVRNADAWRGHGLGVIVQGLGLFVLDGVAYLASRGRSRAISGAVEVSAVPGPAGGGVVVRF